MEPNNTLDEKAGSSPADGAQATPADALERSNDNLTAETQMTAVALTADGKPPQKPNALKAILKKFNVYLLLFGLVLVIGLAVAIVSYLNSKKLPSTPTIATQSLTQDTLKQLAASDATVGGSGQTLSVEGNAIFSGQVLVRSDLSVAGGIKVGTELSLPKLSVSGPTSLNATQVNTLQVATGSTFQGTVTIQHDLNVGGTTAFNGPVTAAQLTVSKLILSGNSSFQISNHLAFVGASPSRSINAGVLGTGGSSSVVGSDSAGTISVNTGSGTTAGCFVTLSFNQPYATAPRVVVTPIGSAAGQTQWYVNRDKNGFSICTNNAAPTGQAFAYDYFVTAAS